MEVRIPIGILSLVSNLSHSLCFFRFFAVSNLSHSLFFQIFCGFEFLGFEFFQFVWRSRIYLILCFFRFLAVSIFWVSNCFLFFFGGVRNTRRYARIMMIMHVISYIFIYIYICWRSLKTTVVLATFHFFSHFRY